MKNTNVAIGIVVRSDSVLICRRPGDVPLAGYWEFPGGKCEPGETPEACVGRELQEELGVRVSPLRALATIHHQYPHAKVHLHPYLCKLETGEPKPLASEDLRWVEPRKLREFSFPPANKDLIDQLITELSPPTAELPETD